MKYLISFNNLILEKSIGSEETRLKWYADLDKKLFYKIVNIDPTSIRNKKISKLGKYSKWLLMQYKKNNLNNNLLYDESFTKKLNYYLFIFSTGWYKSYSKVIYYDYPNRGQNDFLTKIEKVSFVDNDILKFDLQSFTDMIGKLVSRYENETDKSKFDTVYSDENLSVLVPLNFASSRETALNTTWCSQVPIGFSNWNSTSILFRIIPKSKKLDKVKLTWTKGEWFMAPQKYPEIHNWTTNSLIGDNWKPFDKNQNGKETWEILVEKVEVNDKDHWKRFRDTVILLSDKAKQTINEYWEKNINSKR